MTLTDDIWNFIHFPCKSLYFEGELHVRIDSLCLPDIEYEMVSFMASKNICTLIYAIISLLKPSLAPFYKSGGHSFTEKYPMERFELFDGKCG